MLNMLNDLFSGLGCVSSAVGIFISLVVDPHGGLSGFFFPSYFCLLALPFSTSFSGTR